MKNVAIILSGCGVYDGSEIHETVLTQLALARHGANVTCAAPNIKQAHVFDHLAGEVSEGETRNVLTEAARLARGEIINVSELDVNAQDAVIFPGGFGAAKNLCNLAFEGASYSVEPAVEALVKQAHAADKAIGFISVPVGGMSLCRTMLPQYSTSSPFRDFEMATHMINASTTTSGA